MWALHCGNTSKSLVGRIGEGVLWSLRLKATLPQPAAGSAMSESVSREVGNVVDIQNLSRETLCVELPYLHIFQQFNHLRRRKVSGTKGSMTHSRAERHSVSFGFV